MSESIKITATLPAWLPPFNSVNALFAAIREEDNVRALNMATFTTYGMADSGYVHIGDAEITLTLKPRDAVVAAQVAALQQELQNERAESMRKQQAILDKISKLSALEFTAPVEPVGAEE